MIKDNIIYFGYGDIAVGSTTNGYVTFREFKPLQKVGSTLSKNDVEWVSELIAIHAESISNFELDKVKNQTNKQVNAGKYILDFSNYNNESVRVITSNRTRALRIMCMAFAC